MTTQILNFLSSVTAPKYEHLLVEIESTDTSSVGLVIR